jgi:hypothetical protein
MPSTTTNDAEIGLSKKELRALFPKWNRKPSYRARALRRDVVTFAKQESERLRMQSLALEAWLRRCVE